MAKKESEEIHFEKMLTKLEAIVGKMEEDQLTLEQSLKCFEKGIKLTHICQKALSDAQQKVEILIDSSDAFETKSFEWEAEDE